MPRDGEWYGIVEFNVPLDTHTHTHRERERERERERDGESFSA